MPKINSKSLSELTRAISSYETTRSNINKSFAKSNSDSAFDLKLEKHLSDVKHGQGYFSSDIAGQLFNKDNYNASQLAQTDVKALQAYSGYSTGLDYRQRAYFVKSIEGNLSQNSFLKKIA